MKNLLFLLLLIAFGNIRLTAQNYFEEFGKISQDQIEMTKCIYDSTADAIVLFDVGKSSFERDVRFHRITRIKILNEAGKKYAEIEIPFYQDGDIQEYIADIKAATYTIVNGQISKITELDTKTCYEEKTSKNWKTLKFPMPDVQPGSIIEYTYSLYSQFEFNLQDWNFQWSIPVLYSSYEVSIPPFYEYRMILQGRDSLDEYSNHEDDSKYGTKYFNSRLYDVVYKYGLKNIPAFVDEEFSPSREDNIIKINFQLASVTHLDGKKEKIMTTWPELVNDYMKHTDFGWYIKKAGSSAFKALKPDSLKGKTQLQQFSYIVDYAKDNFKWNGESRQFANKSPADLLKDKIGNSAEINLWLVGAFQEAGFESYPVLLSTRKHGKILSDYPFSNAFNYVIAYAVADGKPILADATDPYCPNGRISIQCMNDKGLLVDKSNMQWLSLQSPSVSVLNTSIKIDSVGKSQYASVVINASDYEALSNRNKYANDPVPVLEDLSKKMYQVNDASLKFRNPLERSRPYSYMYSLSNKSEIISNKIYIKPFLNEVFTENPLKQKTRTYPVDMTYPVKRTYQSEIVIPEGFKVEFLPEKSSQNDELFELEYAASQNGNSIIVALTYTFKNSVYTPEQYVRVKALFDRIVKKGSEKIVMVRK